MGYPQLNKSCTIRLLHIIVEERLGISEDAAIRLTFTSESGRFHRL